MIDPTTILKKVIISEKAANSTAKANQYVFKVAKTANKVSVRQAIEAAYKGVKVAWVHIINTPEKTKRILTKRGGYGMRLGSKKAIVCLKEGKIELN
jgi:large subunit ribosomal protein L23